MTEYKIENIDNTISNADIIKQLSDHEFVININNTEKNINVISVSADSIEFMLSNTYHIAKYVERSSSKIKLIVDGIPITLTTHHKLNDVVYKNSGGSVADAQTNLISQIPGKVISVKVDENTEVKKGDIICVLESMKMQVSVKSHKDGVVKKINVKTGSTVAKNDTIAEIE